jgi:Ribonucleases P/MRP protein subunit POP1
MASRKRSANDSHPQQQRQRQRQRQPAWRLAQDLPDFLDASASVSASTFGARRLPEIKALWKAATVGTATCSGTSPLPEEPLKSSGCKTSSRHLRRRATSHKARKRHRFPTSSSSSSSAAAAAKKDDAGNDNGVDGPATRETATATSTSRRSQRKQTSQLTLPHETWWRRQDANEAKADNEKPISWMTTHVWHSKRFHMAHLWGWQVPMVHTNRGPKAALRLVREGKTLLQDVTWHRAANPIILQVALEPHKELLLQSILKRICPDFLLNFQSPSKTTCDAHVTTGQGMAYSFDQFPRNALGPMTWLIQRRHPIIGGPGVEESGACEWSHYCYFWTHPAIYAELWKEFQSLQYTCVLPSSAGGSKVSSLHATFHAHPSTATQSSRSNVGMACFKLRGINATTTLQTMLSIQNDADRQHDNQLLLNDHELHIRLPHGTPMLITVNVGDATEATEGAPLIGNCQALLVAHCEATDPYRNEPGVGWDLYCDALIAKDLFVALVVQGQACPIGVLEEAYTKLDCEPPIADIFPRDYPETIVGQKYWGITSIEGTDDATMEDATMLRLCLEEGEGGGRIDVPTIKARCGPSPSAVKQPKSLRLSSQNLCQLRWYDLVKATGGGTPSEDKERIDCATEKNAYGRGVMMRRSFCKPVYDAIAGSGKFVAAAEASQQQKRRKRRTAKQSSWICHVMPLNRTEAESHMLSCKALLQSLVLPALISCHLKVLGKGTMNPGAQIHSGSEATDSQPLGYVTAASFSAARGCSHGTGVVGASRLLQTVIGSFSTSRQAHSSLAVVDIQGERRIELIVRVQNGAATMKATLELLS